MAVTQLGLTGTPGRGPLAVFGPKGEATEDTKLVSDSLIPRLTEGPFNAVSLLIDDMLTPVITEVGIASLTRLVSDTITARLTDAISSLQKSGTFPKAVADGLVVVIGESIANSVLIAVSDDLLPVLTEAVDSLATPEIKEPTDTLTPVLTETLTVQIQLGQDAFDVEDELRVLLADSASAIAWPDVDIINIEPRPFGLIKVTLV